MMRVLFWILVGVMAIASPAIAFVSGTPVPTDSRIKTFVYHANDVYRVLTHYGYQMNIELGEEEEIETISVGDRSGWQITPDENRIFIRAMQDKSHTNMTVVTDQRSYQFDLYSSKPGERGWDELVYVIRFYYPDKETHQFSKAPQPKAMPASFPSAPMPAPAPMLPQMPLMPAMSLPLPAMPTINPSMPPMTMMPPVAPLRAPVPPAMSPTFPTMPSVPPFSPQLSAPGPSLCMVPALCAPSMPSMSPPSPMAVPPQPMMHPFPPVSSMHLMHEPFGMVPPGHMSVAPPPYIPHSRSAFVANRLSSHARNLTQKYPQNSYQNSMLAPPMLPSLEATLHPHKLSQGSAYHLNHAMMGAPLPSAVPGRYMDF